MSFYSLAAEPALVLVHTFSVVMAEAVCYFAFYFLAFPAGATGGRTMPAAEGSGRKTKPFGKSRCCCFFRSLHGLQRAAKLGISGGLLAIR